MKANTLILLTLSVMCCGASIGSGDERRISEELPATSSGDPIVIYRKVYLNETLPELGSRLYDKVDYELKLRKLTLDIRVAEAERDVQRERVRVYHKEFGNSNALFLTRQNAQLDVVRTEAKLKLLRQQQLLALRHRNDQVRYRKLLIAEGAVRLQFAE
ncbi:MAG: hypothetical protein O3C40_10560 [Planctomycetota bacterium]|nr:hypothetical protein [Planctomycetota bacterium]